MPRALICVQGINKHQGYLLSAVNKNPWLKNRYDEIVDVETEKHFDRKLLKIPFLKDSFTAQYLGDAWNFYKNTSARKAVCREVRKAIKQKQSEGFEVDVIAHSLGTVITLCCGPHHKPNKELEFGRFFCLASPLGFGFKPIRRGIWGLFEGTVNHFTKFNDSLIARKIFYLYSAHDYVSKVLDPKAMPGLDQNSHSPVSYYWARDRLDIDHEVEEYLMFLKEQLE